MSTEDPTTTHPQADRQINGSVMASRTQLERSITGRLADGFRAPPNRPDQKGGQPVSEDESGWNLNADFAFFRPFAGADLSFRDGAKFPIHRLPFVNLPERAPVVFWAVPKRGGYFGGNMTGEALALIYLKHLRQHGHCGGAGLQTIVLGMFESLSAAGYESEEMRAFRGQLVGFLSTLGSWLGAAVRDLGAALDTLDEEDLLSKANSGLNFDEHAWRNTLSDDEEWQPGTTQAATK